MPLKVDSVVPAPGERATCLLIQQRRPINNNDPNRLSRGIKAMTDCKSLGGYQLQASVAKLNHERHDTDSGYPDGRGAETYGEYAQRTCMTSRQRLRLIARDFRERLQHSTGSSKGLVRHGLMRIGARAGLAASKKLHRLAERIERKAVAIRAKG